MTRGPVSESSSASPSSPVGFTMPDGLAIVAGAAVASVHLRDALPLVLDGWSWLLAAFAFGGITITATGPFVAAFAAWVGPAPPPREPPRLRTGEKLWLALGTPWGLFGVLRTAMPTESIAPDGWVRQLFFAALGLTTLVVFAVAWRTWLRPPADPLPLLGADSSRPPGLAAESEPEPEQEQASTWTNRIGFVLAMLWPLQFALAMLTGGRS